jgi:HAE1 family hydrophobic/amphiphilic exporter-1
VEVVVDPNKAIASGLTAAQVGGEVRAALTGQVATRMQLPDSGLVDVVVRLDPAVVSSVERLRTLPVGTAAKVPLGSIATVEQVEARGSITRIDQAPAASITAEISSADTGAVSSDIQRTIDDLGASGAIPPGVQVRLAGVTEQQREAFGGLYYSMAVAVLLVYVMLVLTFDSLLTPFVILLSLPLATIGAFPALYLTGRPIGVSSLIGFLMLIGIVVTNAIVLLDLVERLRAEGHPTREALIEGGKTRVRPILMTAIATILALVPLAAGFNQGSIIAAELGTVVIGGLFSSTFLTLIVVPVVYSLVAGGKSMLGREGRPERAAVPIDAVARVTSIAPMPETPVRPVAPAAPLTGPDGADAQRKLDEIKRILGS